MIFDDLLDNRSRRAALIYRSTATTLTTFHGQKYHELLCPQPTHRGSKKNLGPAAGERSLITGPGWS